MKGKWLVGLVVIAVSGLALFGGLGGQVDGTLEAAAYLPRVVHRIQISPPTARKPVVEDIIPDPRLQEAWWRLNQNQDAIVLWDRSTLTGRYLAQFLLQQAIPVVWDTNNICGGGACSVLTCSKTMCWFGDGKAGVEPIYVSPAYADDRQSLLAILAHEIYHRTQPFGAGPDTRFEEYWAFRIESKVTGSAWLKFGAYDPLDPGHLDLWIKDNRLDGYFKYLAYPASVVPFLHRPSVAGDPFDGISDAMRGGGPNGGASRVEKWH